MQKKTCLYWFRQDLRLSDNPALLQALKHPHVLAIYIVDDENTGSASMGAAAQVYLHQSLQSLNEDLSGALSLYRGNAQSILDRLIKQFDITAVYWNRCYQPWQIARDSAIKKILRNRGITVKSYNASLLWEPWIVAKKDGSAYQIFTPFYRRGCLSAEPPRAPFAAPAIDTVHWLKDPQALPVSQLSLLPSNNWYQNIAKHWQISEKDGQQQLQQFIENQLPNYQSQRDFADKEATSKLSPYLRFGQVSVHQIWQALQQVNADDNVDCLCSQLGWREFSYYLLYHHPKLAQHNLKKAFDTFAWQTDQPALMAWQNGQTGIPIIDAGMRELWQTGYMHNRIRLLVGSFLVKNLLQHWKYGQSWFWDCLVDADLANNAASWQWIAGCGSDAAPYFRIFNPITQAQKFDPEGIYIRRYLPEIASLPTPYLFSPWQAPAGVLADANIRLGKNYPLPIVDIKNSRERALAAYQQMKETGQSFKKRS